MKVAKKRVLLVLILYLELMSIVTVLSMNYFKYGTNSSKKPFVDVKAENDLSVVIRREQQYFKNNTEVTMGYIMWADLKDQTLSLYGNTSKSEMFSYSFWDEIGNYTSDMIHIYPDHINVHIRTTELYYKIYGAYHPDYFQDTNFIVIFDTFWAQFSYITPEGKVRYAPVNYFNKQILPKGAGLVSYAPTDGAILNKEGKDQYSITWQYKGRMMDPFHQPFPYEITYTFDPIYLAFTEQMYQNQEQRQKNESEKNLLDTLQTYFKIIAFFAVFLSIVAALVGYLRAKRKLKSKLEQARSMPKRMIKDIEAEPEPKKRVSAMFSAGFIFILLILPMMLQQPQITTYDTPLTLSHPKDNGIVIGGNPVITNESNRNIQYYSTIDLRKDGLSFETVTMELPYRVANFSIWANTSNVLEFKAYDRSGLPVSYEKFSDHYLIHDINGYIKYELMRPYTYYNNSNILVYIDYFWLSFFDQELNNYSKADIVYTVILPQGALLYSASPESTLSLSKTPEGRKKVTFIDYDRQIDPYHDLFSCQVTYSFVDVLDAIENQSARFEHFRVNTELNQQQISTLTKNVLFLALIAIIAPILAFLLSYYIMRNRLLKKIKEEEEKHELLISVEKTQIDALSEAQKIDINKTPWKAMLGGYWELLAYLSRYMPVSLLTVNDNMHEKFVKKYLPPNFTPEILNLLSTGRALMKSWTEKKHIYYSKNQARDYLEAIMKLMEKMENKKGR